MMRKFVFILTYSCLLVCHSAFAQFAWIDEKGNKQFSDKPPPSSIPESKILKGFKISKSGTTTASSSNSTVKSISERDEDYQKRQKEYTEKQQKQALEQTAQSDKQKNCSRARNYLQSLESGVRVAVTDDKGEKSFMDETQRKNELDDVKKALANCN